MFDYDLIIIGAGSAGLPAGMYASRYRLKNIIIGEMPWGALATSHEVENWPWVISASGGQIMDSFLEQAKHAGSELLQDRVSRIEPLAPFSFRITTQWGKTFTSRTVIFATGNEYRHLDVPWEHDFLWKGVSYCATCDGNFFRGLVVSVVWGWNTAITESLYLASLAKEVHILVRSDSVRAENVWMDKISRTSNITIHYNTVVKEIRGNSLGMTDILLESGEMLPCDGIFIAVGTIPNTALLDGLGVKKESDDTIIINARQETNIPWLYAAGDVTNGSYKFRQTIMSAAEWCLAAHTIHEDLLRLHD